MNAVYEMLERMSIDEKGQALIQAALNKNMDKMKEILALGVDPNIKGPGGWTALRITAWHGDYSMAELVLNHGALVDDQSITGQTALLMASSYGHIRLVKLLLNRGADPNIRNLNNSTALMIACFHGYGDIVKELLRRGAVLAIQNKQGKTAMTFAMEMGHEEIVGLLLEAENHFYIPPAEMALNNSGMYFTSAGKTASVYISNL
jgi:ankyrin repeat protein